MLAVKSIMEMGSSGIIIDIECHFSNGLPGIVIVGLGSKAVDEARERVRSAFASSKVAMPRKRITINLAPADIHKESTGFDLAIALSILQVAEMLPAQPLSNAAVIGELGLDGSVRPVRGIIGKLLVGKANGIKNFFIPALNLAQSLLIPGITAIPVDSLKGLIESIRAQNGMIKYDTDKLTTAPPTATIANNDTKMSDIAGQEGAKRALIIAAAGGHNILLTGPPGTGKSMIAKALPTILPPPSRKEMLEITHIHSLTGTNYEQLVSSRPFRAPHHSTSHVAMIGGGGRLRPGEVSLSHRGVLFLDELPEFHRQTIEALRQPLEDRVITVTRNRESAEFPAHFILVATANPCPCGYYGSSRQCDCPQYRINHYQSRLSGPILDRIDLFVVVQEVAHEELLKAREINDGELDAKKLVSEARRTQRIRYGHADTSNASMTNADIHHHAQLQSTAQNLLNDAAKRLHISARAYMRTVKVARTIADLDNSTHITSKHVAEALQYRPPAVKQ